MSKHPGRTGVNWRHAGGEALLIFLGVAVALLGQAGWEYRVDRGLEQHVLDGIRTDVSRDSADVARGVYAARARIAGADRLLRHLQDPDAGILHPVPWEVPGQAALPDSQAFEYALAEYDSVTIAPQQALYMVVGTLSMQRLDLSDVSFNEATASGQLNVIQDLELRTQIAAYYFAGDRFSNTVDSRAEAQWQRFRGVLAESGLSAVGGEPSERILTALGSDATLLAELKNAREFAVGQAQSHAQLLARAEALISQLDEAVRR